MYNYLSIQELQGYRSVVMTVDRTGGEGGKAVNDEQKGGERSSEFLHTY